MTVTRIASLWFTLTACLLLTTSSIAVEIAKVSAGTDEPGLAFLAENAHKPGVVTLESGLQYLILEQGNGTEHPTPHTPCSCHFNVSYINQTQFDSSLLYGELADVHPDHIITGWSEAIQQMVQGDKWILYIPSELAYGESGLPPRISPNIALIYYVHLVEIRGPTIPALQCNVTTEYRCNDKERAYIQTSKQKSIELLTKELQRASTMKQKKMKPELLEWLRRRIAILQQLAPITGHYYATPKERGAAFLAQNAIQQDVITLQPGFQYKVLHQGTGKLHPLPGTNCLCHLEGRLINGKPFDSTYDRGQPEVLYTDHIAKGLATALSKMVVGDKWELYLSWEWGHGDRGLFGFVPGGATVIYIIELMDIQGESVEAIQCDPMTGQSCNQQELEFIDTIKQKDGQALVKDLDRLSAMTGSKMKPELTQWLDRRIHILKQMVPDEKEL